VISIGEGPKLGDRGEGSVIATLTIQCSPRDGKRKRKNEPNGKRNGYEEQRDEQQGLEEEDIDLGEKGPAAALARVLRRQIEDRKSALYQGKVSHTCLGQRFHVEVLDAEQVAPCLLPALPRSALMFGSHCTADR